MPIPKIYHNQSSHRYLATTVHITHEITAHRLRILLIREKYEFIIVLSFSSITSDTRAESAPENKVSANALIQKITVIHRNQSKNGINKTDTHVSIYHNITLNFFQYKSAIVQVGISNNNQTTLLKLHIKAICRRSNHICKRYTI